MAWRNSIKGQAVQFDKNFIYLNGKPVGTDLVGIGVPRYVDSGIDGASGASPREAAGTIDELVDNCTANNGDKIVVMAGHSETFTATGLTLDVAGVEIIGLGWGTAMPTISFNHANAKVAVSADNVSVSGLRCLADVTGVTVGFDVAAGADYFRLTDCEFDVVTTATDEFLTTIIIDAVTKPYLANLKINNGLGGAVAAINFTDAVTQGWLLDSEIIGDYSTANVMGDTTLSTLLRFQNLLLSNGIGGNLGTEPCIEMLTGTTGWIEWVRCYCNLATKAAAIVADTMLLHETFYNEDIASTATSGIIGTASADD